MVKPVKIPITATDKTGKAFGSVKSRLGGLSSSLKSIGSLLAGAFAVKAVVGFSQEIIDLGDEFQKTSLRIGAGVEALSQYKTVAELSGFSFDKFTTGLKKLQKSVQDAAAGLTTAKRGFEAVGISVEKFKDLAPEVQFEVMVEALGKIESSSLRTQVAMDLMGRSGVDLLTVVEGGAEGLRKMRMEVALLGGTMSEETAQDFAEFNDAVTMAGVGLNALGRGIVEFILPAIKSFFDGITVVTLRLRQFFNLIDKDQLKKMREEWEKTNEVIGNTTSVVTDEQQKAIDVAEKLRQKQFKLVDAMNLQIKSLNRIKGAYEQSTEAGEEMSERVDILNTATKAGIDNTTGFGKAWLGIAVDLKIAQRELDETKKAMKLLEDTGLEMGRAIAGGFEDVITKAKSVKESLVDVIQQISLIALRKSIIDPLGKSIGGSISDLFKSFPAFASGGSFEVGGRGGTDNNLVAFRATKGEEVSIKTPAQQRASGAAPVTAGPTIFADMRGASVEAVQRLERFVAELNGSIEPRAVDAVLSERQRDPAKFGAT